MAAPRPVPKNRFPELLSQIEVLEKKLRDLIRECDVAHPQLDNARIELRERFEELIFCDYDAALKADAEIRLWKFCFYRHIEEYRKLLRQRGPSQDVLARSYRAFLTGASGFYLALLTRLQAHFGLRGVLVDLTHLGLDGLLQHPPPTSPATLGIESCHRCLVYLGDLARYLQQNSSTRTQTFLHARLNYEHALQLLPDDGGPHNQLAVLSTYTADYHAAAYHYVRSILAHTPSTNAADNLARLLGETRLALSKPEFLSQKGLLTLVIALCTSPATPDPFPDTLREQLKALLFDQKFSPLLADPLGPLRLAVLSMYSVHVAAAAAETREEIALKNSEAIILRHFEIFSLYLDACIALVAHDNHERIMAATKALCDWARARASLWSDLPALREHRVWRSLASLLNGSVAGLLQDPTALSSPLWNQSMPLPEDRELRGLLPLRDASHLSLVHAAFSNSVATSLTEETRLRARCLTAFGLWLSATGSFAVSPLLLHDTASGRRFSSPTSPSRNRSHMAPVTRSVSAPAPSPATTRSVVPSAGVVGSVSGVGSVSISVALQSYIATPPPVAVSVSIPHSLSAPGPGSSDTNVPMEADDDEFADHFVSLPPQPRLPQQELPATLRSMVPTSTPLPLPHPLSLQPPLPASTLPSSTSSHPITFPPSLGLVGSAPTWLPPAVPKAMQTPASDASWTAGMGAASADGWSDASWLAQDKAVFPSWDLGASRGAGALTHSAFLSAPPGLSFPSPHSPAQPISMLSHPLPPTLATMWQTSIPPAGGGGSGAAAVWAAPPTSNPFLPRT